MAIETLILVAIVEDIIW